MNREVGSIVANRMYAFGETYTIAKTWAVANLAAVAADIDNVQADITTLGGQALPSRAIAWYDRNTLFASLPASSPSPTSVPGLNITGQDGKVVSVVSGAFALAAGGGGSAITGVGPVGSTPNANGLSVSGSNIIGQPASATLPGMVVPAAQDFGAFNKTIAGLLFTSSATPSISFGAGPYVQFGGAGAGDVFVGSAAGRSVVFQHFGTTRLNLTGGVADFSGMGTGGQIKLKDTLGATRTCTIDGTTGLWVIV